MYRRILLACLLVALAVLGAVGMPTVVLAQGDTQASAQGGVWYTVRPVTMSPPSGGVLASLPRRLLPSMV